MLLNALRTRARLRRSQRLIADAGQHTRERDEKAIYHQRREEPANAN
jgi:hypothetical protein